MKSEELINAERETMDAMAALFVAIRKHTDELPEPVRSAAVRYSTAVNREIDLEELENANAASDTNQPI